MARNEYTTNRKYRHLTREKRAQIEVLRGTVQKFGRNPEPYTRYFGDSGQRVHEHRRRNSHCPLKPAKAK